MKKSSRSRPRTSLRKPASGGRIWATRPGLAETLAVLKGVAEPTRLRLLALGARGELTVGEIAEILGQSQPRVSRHLKKLADAGLFERIPEGNAAFYRLALAGPAGELAERLAMLVPATDPVIRDDSRRATSVERARSRAAQAFFRRNAPRWDEIRSLHVDEKIVEAALLAAIPAPGVDEMLDIGTGTGRMLQLFAARAKRAVGIDVSREMLALARANLLAAELRHCTVRQADMYRLPWSSPSFDLVTMHQVLHYAEQPMAAIAQAARVLRPGGHLLIVDFARHEQGDLAARDAHRHLGFAETDILDAGRHQGLRPVAVRRLWGGPLTVLIWHFARAEGSARGARRSPAASRRKANR
ncbi:MAG: metalloregulator ArsR/SmtB family transcription factor [Alphaproteobacteria bacterium]